MLQVESKQSKTCILSLLLQHFNEMSVCAELQNNSLSPDSLLDFVRSVFSDQTLEFQQAPVKHVSSSDYCIYILSLHRTLRHKSLHLVLKIMSKGNYSDSFFRIKFAAPLLIEMGLKLPKVYFVGSNTTLFDGTCILMDFLPGKILLNYPVFLQMDILGRSHAELHQTDCLPLIRGFRKQDVNEDQYLASIIIAKRLDYMVQQFPCLSPIVDWCFDHSFLWDKDVSICHGDYHPGNILIHKNQISGVLDWSFGLCHPCMDIAWTVLCLDLFKQHQSIYGLQSQLNTPAAAYLKAYQFEKFVDIEMIVQCRTVVSVFALYFSLSYWKVFGRHSVRQSLLNYIFFHSGIKVCCADQSN